jgi:hypothetical protein
MPYKDKAKHKEYGRKWYLVHHDLTKARGVEARQPRARAGA